MADFAQISVSEDQLKIDPGSDASTTISIRNSGSVVDVFTVEIAGLDESWVDLSVSSVSLFPGDQSTSELKLTVPRDGTALAQTYPFTVKVASRKDPSQTVDVECALDVGAYYELEATIDPQQARGGSHSYSVLLSNTGNAELSVTLEGSDPQGNSSFTYSQRTARIAPGKTQTVTVTVVANNRPLRGRPRTRGFTIQASPAQGTAPPATLMGSLEVPPRLPRWAIPAGIGVFVGIAALIAIVVVLTRGGDEPAPAQVAAPSQGQATAIPIPSTPAGPITLTVAQPLAGNFELAPEQERNFEVVVKEPGFVLIQLGWNVTGNGLLVKLEVAEDDPAVLKGLENEGAPLVLLEEELTEPTGEYRVPVGDAYIDVTLRVVLRNDTPDPTNGSVSVFFQRMPPATATATKTNTPTPTRTATPAPTATEIPPPAATNTPTPTNTARVIKITPIIRLTPLLKLTQIIIDGGPVILPALIPTNTQAPTPTNTPAPTPTNTPTPTATNTPLAISQTPINLTPILKITFVIFQTPTPTPLILIITPFVFPTFTFP